MAKRGVLEQPATAVVLARQLAIGDLSTADLAVRHGCSQQAIRDFGRRHAQRVLEVRRCLDDQFAGIVYSGKVARVAAYSKQAEDIAALLADPESTLRLGVGRAEMERVFQSALRSIAEELGQLPARLQVQVSGSLDVVVNGVELGDLR